MGDIRIRSPRDAFWAYGCRSGSPGPSHQFPFGPLSESRETDGSSFCGRSQGARLTSVNPHCVLPPLRPPAPRVRSCRLLVAVSPSDPPTSPPPAALLWPRPTDTCASDSLPASPAGSPVLPLRRRSRPHTVRGLEALGRGAGAARRRVTEGFSDSSLRWSPSQAGSQRAGSGDAK